MLAIVVAVIVVAVTILFSAIFSGQKKAEDFLSDKYIEDLFSKFDVDKSGRLEKAEVEKLVASILNSQSRSRISKKDHETIYSLIDKNHDGDVSLEELKQSLHDWLPIDGRRCALIVVDLQNDFLTGSLPVTGGEDAVLATNELRKKFTFDVIAHTRDWHPDDHCSFAETWKAERFTVRQIPAVGGGTIDQMMWPKHCVQKQKGAEFHPKLVVEPSDYIVDKGINKMVDSYSGFFDNSKGSETTLRGHLKKQGISEVFVVGVAFDYCVGSTALDAVDCGFTAYIVDDCAKVPARTRLAGLVMTPSA
jgi:nicotinamidase/pyrazinamidase